MKIDIIMMSKFGFSDGGRETWFNNFFHEIEADQDQLQVVLYSLKLKPENIVDFHLKGKNLVENHEIDTGKKGLIPLTILFIIKLCFFIFSKNNRSNQVVAVGSLNDMLACFFSYPPIIYKGKKIVWLRTISRREFGMKTKILRFPLIFIEYLLLKFYFDRVLTNGKDTGDFYTNIGIKNKVINNGVSKKKWFNAIDINQVNELVTIAFVGRLEKNKGIISFCDAIECFNKKKNNNVQFIIVGQGGYRDKVISLTQKEKNVEYINGINNMQMPELLKKVNVSVALTFSSDSMGGGGLSNALLEQMCSGNLIIAWDNPIFRQILNEGNAILVEQDNIDMLVDAFIRVSAEYKNMTEFREKSQNLSIEYSTANNKKQFLDILYEPK